MSAKWTGRRVMAARRLIYQRDKGICGICHRPAPLNQGDIDHIVPRSLGGPVWAAENMRWTHASCNRSRGNRGGTNEPTRDTETRQFPISLPGGNSSRVW